MRASNVPIAPFSRPTPSPPVDAINRSAADGLASADEDDEEAFPLLSPPPLFLSRFDWL